MLSLFAHTHVFPDQQEYTSYLTQCWVIMTTHPFISFQKTTEDVSNIQENFVPRFTQNSDTSIRYVF